MTDIETAVAALLAKGRDVVLATIVHQTGSTPRTAGAKMLVHADGSIQGTVGGGLVEARVIRQAQAAHATHKSSMLTFDLSSETLLSSLDLICGGALEVLVEFIDACEANQAFFTELASSLAAGEACAAAIVIQTHAEEFTARRMLIGPNGCRVGSQHISDDEAAQLYRGARQAAGLTVVELDGRSFAVERCAHANRLFVFGAGHVSQAVVSMAALVDFQVVVLDDRDDFCTRQRFPAAHQLEVLDDFANAFENLTVGPHGAVVILTRGHTHDKTVLAQALATPAGYIGMIGSRRKRQMIYQSLLDEGFSQTDLQRVHSPVGLPINAETPAEIAVSIVAELIQERRRMLAL